MIDEILSSVIESVGEIFGDSAGETIEVLNEAVDKDTLIETAKSIADEAPDILCNAIPDSSVYSNASTKKDNKDELDLPE